MSKYQHYKLFVIKIKTIFKLFYLLQLIQNLVITTMNLVGLVTVFSNKYFKLFHFSFSNLRINIINQYSRKQLHPHK